MNVRPLWIAWCAVVALLLLVARSIVGPGVSATLAEDYEYGSSKQGPVPVVRQPQADVRLRQPIALVLDEAAGRLWVGNRKSGSVQAISLADGKLLEESLVGKRLADLIAWGDSRLLAVDEEAESLLLLSRTGTRATVAARTPLSPNPVSVALSLDGQQAYVASLWSRRLNFVDLRTALEQGRIEQASSGKATPEKARGVSWLDLPFAPRKLLVLRYQGAERLIVADAFGGQLGIVDPARRSLLFVRQIPGHHLRGMALSHDGQRLVVAHQILNSLAETSQNDVHWGVLMTNVLRWLVLDRVMQPDAEILKGSHVHPPGDTSEAGGDPENVVVTREGKAVMARAGVDEVAIGTADDPTLRRIRVGRRPTAVAASADGRRAFVANALGDSVHEIDIASRQLRREISLGGRPTLSSIERGENLFYNARLSLDGWYSCHSCHTDGHSIGMLVDNLSDGTYGTPKRIVSLLGAADTAPWAWNGGVDALEKQMHNSVRSTMQGREISEQDAADLAAFVKTLKPPPSLPKLRGELDADATARGEKLFDSLNCRKCHAPPTYTSHGTFFVGLVDQKGMRRFNPPSLRGVGQAGPYFHDGSAARLEDVFSQFKHQLPRALSAEELSDLVAFLRSL